VQKLGSQFGCKYLNVYRKKLTLSVLGQIFQIDLVIIFNLEKIWCKLQESNYQRIFIYNWLSIEKLRLSF
jgi:hypothetical protein